MKLNEFVDLLKKEDLLVSYFPGENPEIGYITCDSRKTVKGTLFFCKGISFKEEYLVSATENGAVAYISEKEYPDIKLPCVIVSDIRRAMPLSACFFYNRPFERYSLAGITGTKGKTTVAYMLKNIYDEEFGGKSGLISTIDGISCGKKFTKSFTTPEALDLYSYLSKFAEDGVRAAVIEVSSQGLQYNRVDGIIFDYGVFLNLAPDHISETEHHSFDEYKEAKKKMLTLCKTGFVNADDQYASEIICAATCKKIITFGYKNFADITAKKPICKADGSEFTVCGGKYDGEIIKVGIPGDYNILNALAAYAVASEQGISIEAIKKGIEKTRIPGHMEVTEIKGRHIVIDYAHNGLSLEGVIRNAKKFYPGSKVICVFGCTGNKAIDRREEMGKVAGRKADYIILTSDDPAYENEIDIAEEIAAFIKPFGTPFENVEDRTEAIKRAAALSEEGNIIVIAGKGYETTQSVKGKSAPYIGDKVAIEMAFD